MQIAVNQIFNLISPHTHANGGIKSVANIIATHKLAVYMFHVHRLPFIKSI